MSIIFYVKLTLLGVLQALETKEHLKGSSMSVVAFDSTTITYLMHLLN